MTNRITIFGKLVDAPKLRTFEARGDTVEIVSLWIEVQDGDRRDRFTVEINDGKAAQAAKAMKQDTLVEVTGKLRHDRWRHKDTKTWVGKVFIAVDPADGAIRSKGVAQNAQTAQAA